MGLHTCNPGTLEAEEEDIPKCKSGLRPKHTRSLRNQKRSVELEGWWGG